MDWNRVNDPSLRAMGHADEAWFSLEGDDHMRRQDPSHFSFADMPFLSKEDAAWLAGADAQVASVFRFRLVSRYVDGLADCPQVSFWAMYDQDNPEHAGAVTHLLSCELCPRLLKRMEKAYT